RHPRPSCHLRLRRPPRQLPPSTLFPYTTLFRSQRAVEHRPAPDHRLLGIDEEADGDDLDAVRLQRQHALAVGRRGPRAEQAHHQDRKSTRLNSSHEWISYAVFCLKKKKYLNTRG